MKNRHIPVIALCALLAIMACAVPGAAGDATQAPAATADDARLQEMVEETVAVAIAETERAVPTREVQTVPGTAEPTDTAAATQEPVGTGSSLAAQTDGTILFVDERAAFQVNVSPGWLPVRIEEQEYYDAFSLPVAADAAVQRALMNIKTLDPNTFRLFIYDLQDGHLINGVITSVNFVWDPKTSISLEGEAGVKAAADALAEAIPNLNVDSYEVSATTTNNIPIGVILSNIPGKTFEGTDVVLFQKQVYLNLPAGSLVISFTTEQNFKDATLPFFDTMVETIKINTP
jgi:hypothetical protein